MGARYLPVWMNEEGKMDSRLLTSRMTERGRGRLVTQVAGMTEVGAVIAALTWGTDPSPGLCPEQR